MELNDSILAFVDILGFRKLIENKNDSERLFAVIENIKNQNTKKCSIERIEHGNVSVMRAIPALSSFSDCIAISIPTKDVYSCNFHLKDAVNSLLCIIQQLADSLIYGGYILRGGITKGELHHQDGVVFGKALIEAYELESKKAIVPRILVSEELAKEYNKTTMDDRNNFLKKVDDRSEEYFLNYLKLSFQDDETRKRYEDKTKETIEGLRDGFLCKVNHGDISNLEEDVKVLKNWLYFDEYVKNTKKL